MLQKLKFVFCFQAWSSEARRNLNCKRHLSSRGNLKETLFSHINLELKESLHIIKNLLSTKTWHTELRPQGSSILHLTRARLKVKTLRAPLGVETVLKYPTLTFAVKAKQWNSAHFMLSFESQRLGIFSDGLRCCYAHVSPYLKKRFMESCNALGQTEMNQTSYSTVLSTPLGKANHSVSLNFQSHFTSFAVQTPRLSQNQNCGFIQWSGLEHTLSTDCETNLCIGKP